MTLTISQEIQSLIDERLREGRYKNVQDVLAAALLSLKQQETFGEFNSGELDQLVEAGEESLRVAGTLDGEEAHQKRKSRLGERRNSR